MREKGRGRRDKGEEKRDKERLRSKGPSDLWTTDRDQCRKRSDW